MITLDKIRALVGTGNYSELIKIFFSMEVSRGTVSLLDKIEVDKYDASILQGSTRTKTDLNTWYTIETTAFITGQTIKIHFFI